MTDVEELLRDELEILAPADEVPAPDWAAVRRAGRRLPRHRRLAVAVGLVLVAAFALTLTLSASARELLGLGGRPRPNYAQARLAVSAPIGGGQVARLWVAPSTAGGQCAFLTVAALGSVPRPTRMTGGGACTSGEQRFRGPFWSFSHKGKGRQALATIYGRVAVARAASVELRWRGGSQRLAFADGFFVGSAQALSDPPFSRLPFDLVVVDAAGRVASRSRIPTSLLYSDWKQVEPRLHTYRVAHGCEPDTTWRCRSR
jgi:hypothetical protein